MFVSVMSVSIHMIRVFLSHHISPLLHFLSLFQFSDMFNKPYNHHALVLGKVGIKQRKGIDLEVSIVHICKHLLEIEVIAITYWFPVCCCDELMCGLHYVHANEDVRNVSAGTGLELLC